MTPRQAALLELLQQPDDDGLRRASVLKLKGKTWRFEEYAWLPCIHRTRLLVDRDKDKLCD